MKKNETSSVEKLIKVIVNLSEKKLETLSTPNSVNLVLPITSIRLLITNKGSNQFFC